MDISDARGKNIHTGSHVRYLGTGSAGEVLEVKTDKEGLWAKIDSTKLWYNSRFLEVIDESEYQRMKHKEVERTVTSRPKEDEHVQKVVNLKKKLEDIDMSSELCDGGG